MKGSGVRKINSQDRAINVRAYQLSNELRAWLPDLVRDLAEARARGLYASGRRGVAASIGAALPLISAQELAHALRTALLPLTPATNSGAELTIKGEGVQVGHRSTQTGSTGGRV